MFELARKSKGAFPNEFARFAISLATDVLCRPLAILLDVPHPA
jgi:hypothetical protein